MLEVNERKLLLEKATNEVVDVVDVITHTKVGLAKQLDVSFKTMKKYLVILTELGLIIEKDNRIYVLNLKEDEYSIKIPSSVVDNEDLIHLMLYVAIKYQSKLAKCKSVKVAHSTLCKTIGIDIRTCYRTINDLRKRKVVTVNLINSTNCYTTEESKDYVSVSMLLCKELKKEIALYLKLLSIARKGAFNE